MTLPAHLFFPIMWHTIVPSFSDEGMTNGKDIVSREQWEVQVALEITCHTRTLLVEGCGYC
jgi:hypothetical protein